MLKSYYKQWRAVIAHVVDNILALHRNPYESCKESCKYRFILEINKLYLYIDKYR